jgi:hypothetical protein
VNPFAFSVAVVAAEQDMAVADCCSFLIYYTVELMMDILYRLVSKIIVK